jgi:hypothetical protein
MTTEMKYVQPDNRGRQSLMRWNYKSWTAKKNPIKTLDDLRSALQAALMIELATIPPYLCALYSIREGSNPVAAGLIRSVVMEEMLHLCMAANILNAIGGNPVINHTTMLDYPGPLPKNEQKLIVNLRKFSPEAVDTFLAIEKPAGTPNPPADGNFDSIGQFYTAVCVALTTLDEKTPGGIFKNPCNAQITPDDYYGSGGDLVVVTDLKSANKAIAEIIGQGEGIDGTINDGIDGNFENDIELAHYFRFNEIKQGRRYKKGDTTKSKPSGDKFTVDWEAVYNMQPNPKIAKYRNNPELYKKALEFNQTYAQLLGNIHNACNGKPKVLKEEAIRRMYDLKYQAIELMKIPLGQGTMTAGPTFEPVTA